VVIHCHQALIGGDDIKGDDIRTVDAIIFKSIPLGGQMVQYHFVTQWFFHVPIERVWAAIADSTGWTDWLQDFRRVTVHPATANGETAIEVDYRGDLPYSFHFTLVPTRVEPPYRMELRASGQLVGTGCWTLEAQDDGTAVTYVWTVGVANPIFSAFTRLPFVKALTERNHNATMARAERALKQRLDSQ
jgi:uncharacterized protein YndB with AHSA1/START domain